MYRPGTNLTTFPPVLYICSLLMVALSRMRAPVRSRAEEREYSVINLCTTCVPSTHNCSLKFFPRLIQMVYKGGSILDWFPNYHNFFGYQPIADKRSLSANRFDLPSPAFYSSADPRRTGEVVYLPPSGIWLTGICTDGCFLQSFSHVEEETLRKSVTQWVSHKHRA